MAQTWRVHRPTSKKPRPPLDGEALEQLALFYVGRYATTRAKLRSYLARKLRERGWQGQGEPPLAALADRFAELGYVDDRGFATDKAAALGRRGYGERRVEQALFAAGIEDDDAGEAREIAREGAWDAALAFARKRRIGPFAADTAPADAKRKALAAMLRAGHPYELARKFVEAEPGSLPERDDQP